MTDLPRGWAATTVAEVGAAGEQTVLTGPFGSNLGREDFTSSGVPVLTIGCLGTDGISKSKLLHVSPSTAKKLVSYRLRPGDFLFSRMASVGRAGIVPDDLDGALFNYHLMRLRLNGSTISSRLFFHYVRGSHLVREYLDAVSRGATRDGINTTLLLKMPVWLPPISEQRRIVAKIDSLSANSKRARDNLDHIPRLAGKYKQAILMAAFRGELGNDTARMLPSSHLKDLCISITDGDHQAPPKAANGVPFITIAAMNDGVIKLEKATRFVPQSYGDSLKPSRRPAIDDILYSVTGSIGIPALVNVDDPFVFQRHIAILKPNRQKVSPNYLYRLLAAPQVMEQALAVATGTAQLTIPLAGLREFEIPSPALDQQIEISRRIENAFTWIDRLASEATSARKLIDRLDQAILAKAFRGELVPQDASDEPASVLLERMKAARSSISAERKQKKKYWQ